MLRSAGLMPARRSVIALMCTCAALLAEFEDVLQREKFRARLESSGRNVPEIVSRLRSAALNVNAQRIPVPARLRDSDDVHLLACATTAGADAIVTGDNDLLAMKSFHGIPILTVRGALELLGVQAE
jgi:uncharacterized protein